MNRRLPFMACVPFCIPTGHYARLSLIPHSGVADSPGPSTRGARPADDQRGTPADADKVPLDR